MRAKEPSRDGGRAERPVYRWDARSVRALRRHLGVSQRRMAADLGTRQQTVSEWETGLYRPRGASARVLSIVAERAGFEYDPRGWLDGSRRGRGRRRDRPD